ncbi:MAG: CaiB/BaiF CoA transferase family protein [Candidatus Latescibacterota bacterium]|jgi:crotonobetainyl-CoA:carnitine CoA-transferase CaiB-like acyl-CoA transferase
MKPLDDIRVLSVTVFLAGPFLSMTLARFGAEVIKVELPNTGDPVRSSGPFHGPKGIHKDRQTEDDLSIRFLKRSEGVKSVTLNLKDAEGRQMFLELAKQSDVLIENLSPGSMTKLGLGYDEVSSVNPAIIYCSIAGYGQTGPYKELPAHDHQIQAMSGIMDMNGDNDGPPTRIGVFVGDLVTPLYCAYSILGALRHKEKSGEGQYLDASMIDTLATLMFMEPMEHILADGLPVRAGNDARDNATGLYQLTDGDVIITVGTPARLKALFTALGKPETMENSRFCTAELRLKNLDALRATIQTQLSGYNCSDAIALLEGVGVPIARVRTIREAIEDQHFRDRGTLKPMYRQDSPVPVEPGVISGFPVRFSGGDLPELEGGAKLGHHNEEVYEKLLGLNSDTLADLKDRGVI